MVMTKIVRIEGCHYNIKSNCIDYQQLINFLLGDKFQLYYHSPDYFFESYSSTLYQDFNLSTIVSFNTPICIIDTRHILYVGQEGDIE